MIKPQYLTAVSELDGFKNYSAVSFSVSVPSQNIGAGGFVHYTAQTALNNSNSISQVQVQYSSLNSAYYIAYGTLNTYWSSSTYEIESMYYFDSTNLNVYTVIVNQTAGTITIPAITINCRGFLFLSPF